MISDLTEKYSGRGVEVTSRIIEGDATEELAELSKKVALIAVGGRVNRKGTISDRILRTVTTTLPAHACCPTVVVGADVLAEHLPVKKLRLE
ncbi:universal stress protein [Arcanobacterium hippocoleae]